MIQATTKTNDKKLLFLNLSHPYSKNFSPGMELDFADINSNASIIFDYIE